MSQKVSLFFRQTFVDAFFEFLTGAQRSQLERRHGQVKTHRQLDFQISFPAPFAVVIVDNNFAINKFERGQTFVQTF